MGDENNTTETIERGKLKVVHPASEAAAGIYRSIDHELFLTSKSEDLKVKDRIKNDGSIRGERVG